MNNDKWEDFKSLQKKVNIVGISGLLESEEKLYSCFLAELHINGTVSEDSIIHCPTNKYLSGYYS